MDNELLQKTAMDFYQLAEEWRKLRRDFESFPDDDPIWALLTRESESDKRPRAELMLSSEMYHSIFPESEEDDSVPEEDDFLLKKRQFEILATRGAFLYAAGKLTPRSQWEGHTFHDALPIWINEILYYRSNWFTWHDASVWGGETWKGLELQHCFLWNLRRHSISQCTHFEWFALQAATSVAIGHGVPGRKTIGSKSLLETPAEWLEAELGVRGINSSYFADNTGRPNRRTVDDMLEGADTVRLSSWRKLCVELSKLPEKSPRIVTVEDIPNLKCFPRIPKNPI